MQQRLVSTLLRFWLLCVLITGCTSMKLVSEYDERIDVGVSEFQRQIDFFLIRLKSDSGKAEARYENRQGFYDSMRVELNLLHVRSEVKPLNSRTTEQIQLLTQSLETLGKLHQSFTFLPPSQIGILQSGFDRSCGAILKFELEKKRGEKNGGN